MKRLKRKLQMFLRKALGIPENPWGELAYPVGFGPEDIEPNKNAIVETRAQVPFRPHALVIPSAIAGDVMVNDIQIGKNSQLASGNSIPGQAFVENSNFAFQLQTAQVSQAIKLNITNTSDKKIRFVAAMVGRAIE